MKHRVLIVTSIAAVVLGGCAGTRTREEVGKVPAAPTAKSIVERYAMLIYGADKKRNHSSTTMKGTLSIEQFGIDGPVVSYAVAPDGNVTNIEMMGTTLSTGCHKGACWSQQPGGRPTVLSGGAAAMQLQQADYHQWNNLDRYYSSIEIVPPADGTEKPNYEIRAMRPAGDADRFFFDKETGLLRTAIYNGETPQGRMEITVQFKSYTDYEGELIPMQLVQSFTGVTMALTFSEISHAPISEEKLVKPE